MDRCNVKVFGHRLGGGYDTDVTFMLGGGIWEGWMEVNIGERGVITSERAEFGMCWVSSQRRQVERPLAARHTHCGSLACRAEEVIA